MGDPPGPLKQRILPEDMFTIGDLETLKVVTDPLRLQMLNLLRGQPHTAKELAKALHLPQTKLYYHIDLLEKHGLIRVVATRLVSGILEKQYQATAYKLTVDRALFWMAPSAAGQYEGLEVFLSAVLDYTHSDIMRSVRSGLIDFGKDAPADHALDIGRIWFRLSPEQVVALQDRLKALVQEFQPPHLAEAAEGTQLYEFLLAFYPTHEHPPVGEQPMGITQWTPEGESPIAD